MTNPTSAKNPANYELVVITSSKTGLKAQLPAKFAKRPQKQLDGLVAEAHGVGAIHAAVRSAMAMTAV